MINIMIIDDESLVRASIQSFLDWESHGYTFLLEASNGREALDILAQNPEVDLILLDMHMPQMDGIAFLEALQDFPNPPVIIILSANDQYQYVRRSFQLGAVDYILKMEIDEENLLALLNKSTSMIRTNENRSRQEISAKDRDYVEKKLIQDLLHNENEDLTHMLIEDFGLQLEFPLRLCSIWMSHSDIDESSAYLELISIQCRQYLKRQGSGMVCSLESGEWIFLLHLNGDQSYSLNKAELFCHDFIGIVKDSHGIELDYALSSHCDTIDELPSQYQYVKSLHRSESRMVRRAKKYIRKYYAQSTLSLEDVSEHVEVSKTHLSAQFRKESGQTFKDYLTHLRIEEAKTLLCETNLKVYEISEKVGYPSVEHFSRIFKKVTAMTPNKFDRG